MPAEVFSLKILKFFCEIFEDFFVREFMQSHDGEIPFKG